MASSNIDLSQLCGGYCAGDFASDGMDALLTSWFRYHFSSAGNLPANLQNRVWIAQPSSPIFIDLVDEWRPETTDLRPAVMFRDDGFDIHPYGIGNRLMGSEGVEAYKNNQAAVIVGAYTILCVSQKPAECRALTVEVFKELTAHGNLVRDRFGLARLRSGPVTGRKLVEQATQQFVMTIPVVYGVFWSYQLVDQEAQIIQQINAAVAVTQTSRRRTGR